MTFLHYSGRTWRRRLSLCPVVFCYAFAVAVVAVAVLLLVISCMALNKHNAHVSHNDNEVSVVVVFSAHFLSEVCAGSVADFCMLAAVLVWSDDSIWSRSLSITTYAFVLCLISTFLHCSFLLVGIMEQYCRSSSSLCMSRTSCSQSLCILIFLEIFVLALATPSSSRAHIGRLRVSLPSSAIISSIFFL